jgi:hypothetical protein
MNRVSSPGLASPIRAGLAGFLLVAGFGCGGAPDARYVPSEPVARRAVENALAAWRNGQAPGRLAGHTPAIQVIDTHRRPGQVLKEYEILGEVYQEGPRTFTVRLALDQPAETVNVRYCVVGIDPLWVFREEEYHMITHWECLDTTAKGAGSVSVKK